MHDAVVVEAVRTAVGRRGGALAGLHPAELLGHTLTALLDRAGVDPSQVDDVVGGCVTQFGEQAANVTRTAWLAAGLPESVPATTVDRQCGSSQQATHFAAQGVMAGVYDIVIACGVESMTRVPMMANVGNADPWSEGMRARYGDDLVPQGLSAEMIAAEWGIDRGEADRLAVGSHARAARARGSGAFDAEIVPIKVTGADGSVQNFTADEGIRPDTTPEGLAVLDPAFRTAELARARPSLPWVVTAGNASQISDGASALLIMSRARASALRLTPRWRFRAFAVAGASPVTMLTAPIPATRSVLEKAGMTVDDIDHFEINEAFSTVVAAWLRDVQADPERVNPRGGAIAIGHPLGASGGRLMTTMLHALEQTGGRFGLQSMCEGGGLANATIVERLG